MKDLKIIKVLQNHFEKKFFPVGGCVRDFVMGVEPKDIDLCTAVNVNEIVKNPPAGCTVVPLGLEHGTVAIIFEGTTYEVSTFRKDVSCDGRHAVVEFTDNIMEDLVRRDFTMNAMAFDTETGEIIDPFNGKEDLSNRVIRAVGDPFTRFAEDHLRMIRACRFSGNFGGMNIHQDTFEAIRVLCANIDSVSKERVREELIKMMKCEKPSVCIRNLLTSGLLAHIIPQLAACVGSSQLPHHQEDVFVHHMMVLDRIPKTDPLLRLAALVHDVGKPVVKTPEGKFYDHHIVGGDMVQTWMEELKFSNEDKEFVVMVVREHMFSVNKKMSDGSIRKLIVRSNGHWKELIEFKRADLLGRIPSVIPEEVAELLLRIEKIATTPAAMTVKDLAISGKDLISVFNLKPGPIFGIMLNRCLAVVLENPSANNRDNLLDIVKENIDEMP